MIDKRLKQCFGPDPAYTSQAGTSLATAINNELRAGQKNEYTSPVGLCGLWERTFHNTTPGMRETKAQSQKDEPKMHELLQQARAHFDEQKKPGQNHVTYEAFADGYAQHHLACHQAHHQHDYHVSSNSQTKQVFEVMELNPQGGLEWEEWKFWLQWSHRMHPEECDDLDGLVKTTFNRGLIPGHFKKNMR